MLLVFGHPNVQVTGDTGIQHAVPSIGHHVHPRLRHVANVVGNVEVLNKPGWRVGPAMTFMRPSLRADQERHCGPDPQSRFPAGLDLGLHE